MTVEDFLLDFLLGGNLVVLLLAGFIILCVLLGVRIVPQSEKHVVERFGRLRAVLGPGINIIVPFLDRVRHKVSILERQLPNASQDQAASSTAHAKSKSQLPACLPPKTSIAQNAAATDKNSLSTKHGRPHDRHVGRRRPHAPHHGHGR